MGLKAWLYYGFSSALVVVLAWIMVYHFRSKRKERMESPKYRMLDDD